MKGFLTHPKYLGAVLFVCAKSCLRDLFLLFVRQDGVVSTVLLRS